MRGNRVKEKLQAGQVATVVVGHSQSADTVDFIGPLGFDGFWLEGEHGPITWDRIGDLSRACDLWNMASIVRVHANETGLMGRTLDCGASGIVVPHVCTREHAEYVVHATRFGPVGGRGIYGGRRSYGQDAYFQEADSEILTVVLIEEIRAVENLDAILEVDDIDVFFVAPGDLAQTMGIVGDFSHPEVQRVVDKSLSRIVAAGRTAGALGIDANLERYLDMGVRFFLTVYDPWIKQGAEALLSRIAEKVE